MKNLLLLFYILYFGIGLAQDRELKQDSIASKSHVSQANHLLEKKGDFPIAEGELRKAIAKNPLGTIAPFNLGNAYYGSQKFDEATDRYKQTAELTDSKTRKHSAYHNLGNSLMQQKQYAKAVEAYKNALRNKPSDNETRYNLALAKKKKMEQQKKQKKEEKNKNKNDKDKKSDQNKKENKGKDKDKKENKEKSEKKNNKKGEDEKKNDKKNNEKKDQSDQNGDSKKTNKGDKPEEKKPAKSIPGQLSPQQVKNLLEAMRNEEKKVQRKINLEKRKGAKKRSEKDW